MTLITEQGERIIMRLARITTRTLAAVVLAVMLTACGTTQLQEATVAYVDTPEGIAEAQESWDIDTASDTPFHDDEDTAATEAEGESANN